MQHVVGLAHAHIGSEKQMRDGELTVSFKLAQLRISDPKDWDRTTLSFGRFHSHPPLRFRQLNTCADDPGLSFVFARQTGTFTVMRCPS